MAGKRGRVPQYLVSAISDAWIVCSDDDILGGEKSSVRVLTITTTSHLSCFSMLKVFALMIPRKNVQLG